MITSICHLPIHLSPIFHSRIVVFVSVTFAAGCSSLISPLLQTSVVTATDLQQGQQLPSQHGESCAPQDDMRKFQRRHDPPFIFGAKTFEQILALLDVFAVLESAIIGELQPEVCAEVLMSSRRLGLVQVEEETVGKLLEEDGLGVVK